MVSRELSAPNSKLMATAMPLATAQDLYDNLMQHSVTGDMLKGREDEPWAPLLLPGGFHQVWRYALQTEIKGRGLDGVVVGLDGDMVAKVNKLRPKELKKCETEECRRSMEAESEERFKKELDYLLNHQNCSFIVPALPVVYVMGENSQRLGYLMPELKSADQFEWPNIPLALHIFRQLISILCFFRKSKVVYSDLKPENILLREVPGGGFEVKLNDFGFVGTVGGEFQGGTEEYLPWKYRVAKRLGGSQPKYPPLDYIVDTYAAGCVVFDICRLRGGCVVDVGLLPEVGKLRVTCRELQAISGLEFDEADMVWEPWHQADIEQEMNCLEPSEKGMMQEVFRFVARALEAWMYIQRERSKSSPWAGTR